MNTSKESFLSFALQEIREQWIQREESRQEPNGQPEKREKENLGFRITGELIQNCIDSNVKIKEKELQHLVIDAALQNLKKVIADANEEDRKSNSNFASREFIKAKISQETSSKENSHQYYYPTKESENEIKRAEMERARKERELAQRTRELEKSLSKNFQTMTDGLSELIAFKVEQRQERHRAAKVKTERKLIPVLLMQTTLRDKPNQFINTKKLSQVMKVHEQAGSAKHKRQGEEKPGNAGKPFQSSREGLSSSNKREGESIRFESGSSKEKLPFSGEQSLKQNLKSSSEPQRLKIVSNEPESPEEIKLPQRSSPQEDSRKEDSVNNEENNEEVFEEVYVEDFEDDE